MDFLSILGDNGYNEDFKQDVVSTFSIKTCAHHRPPPRIRAPVSLTARAATCSNTHASTGAKPWTTPGSSPGFSPRVIPHYNPRYNPEQPREP